MADKNEENEDTKMWREIKQERQLKHADWKAKNTALIKSSGLDFVMASEECIIFRDEHHLSVDFYPSTGRWRDVKSGRVFGGGALLFIAWYKKNENHST